MTTIDDLAARADDLNRRRRWLAVVDVTFWSLFILAVALFIGPCSPEPAHAMKVAKMTLPGFNRTIDGCGPSLEACHDLDSLFGWQHFLGEANDHLFLHASVRGMEGQDVAVPIIDERPSVAWFATSDTTGNRSCDSAYLGINLVAGVEDFPSAGAHGLEVFDVGGRRHHRGEPLERGIYLWRANGVARRVVVLEPRACP